MQALIRFGTLLAAGALLASCGGGGDGVKFTPFAIDGVATSGSALASRPVAARCATGDNVTGSTDSRGSFKLEFTAHNLPCLVEVDGGSAGRLYSITNLSGRLNVTPLTTLITARALRAQPSAAMASADSAALNAANSGVAAASTAVLAEATRLMGWTPVANPFTGAIALGDEDDQALATMMSSLAQASATLATVTTAAAGGTSILAALPAEERRGQDAKTYTVVAADASATTFPALAAAAGDTVDMSTTQRVAGVLASYDNSPASPSAPYRIEVPANWNGELVMYAHGYAGEGPALPGNNSIIRRHLIQNGYAWAASGYSKNSYDVRAGLEDTNKLALAFASLTGKAAPSRIYIMGLSMGGHVAAAAVEEETLATAVNKVRYAGSLPLCGVMAPVEMFNGMAAMGLAALQLSGTNAALPAALSARDRYRMMLPVEANPASVRLATHQALFNGFPNPGFTPRAGAGAAYASVVKNLTGGTRPLFDLGLSFGGSYGAGTYANFGVDGTLTGVLTRYSLDTGGIVYSIDGDAAASAALNAGAPRLAADADWNRLRRDGVRWLPLVAGKPYAPVVTAHTLGDLFVPFSMQQVYRQRLNAAGPARADRVVQRAIRGATHCDFTNAEIQTAFDDLVRWVRQGVKPAGDDVLTPATVAAATYGCTHTRNVFHPVDEAAGTARTLRGLIAQQGLSCPAP